MYPTQGVCAYLYDPGLFFCYTLNMSNDLVKEGYNRAAENYSAEGDVFENQKYLARLAELLQPGSTVLDVGCGAGIPVDKYLEEHGFKVIGLDISEKQIELAKKNLPNQSFQVKDMSELVEGEFQVNAAVSFYAIFHTPRERHPEIFRKINSFLPEGGIILVTMGSGEWEGTEDDFHGAKMFWSHYGAEKNKAIIQEAGFDILFDEVDESGGEKHLVILAKKK